MQYATFKYFMINQYGADELKDIAQYGCANVAPGGMIYYSETTDIYNQYADDLHMIVAEYKDMTGEMPQCLIDNLDNGVQFRNAMVWFCAEYVAQSLATEEC